MNIPRGVIASNRCKQQAVLKHLSGLEKNAQPATVTQVYISYSWHFRRDVIFEIAKRLEKTKNMKIWMRRSPRRRDVVGSDHLPKGLETADLVLLFFSDRYKSSPLCRTEALFSTLHDKAILAINLDDSSWNDTMPFPLNEFAWINCASVEDRAGEFVRKIERPIQDVIRLSKTIEDNRPKRRLKTVEVPVMSNKYLVRQLEEGNVLTDLIQTCLKPEEGVMVITGSSGVGKTTLLSKVLLDEVNSHVFTKQCGLHVAIWLNCYEWRNAETFFTKDKNAFFDRLLQLGQQLAATDNSIKFFDIEALVQHFHWLKKTILFVLDDMFNIELVRSLRRECKTAPICVITQKLPNADSNLFRKPCYIPSLTDQQIITFYKTCYQLNEKLDVKRLTWLAKLSNGLPLVASLIAARISEYNSTSISKEFSFLVNDRLFSSINYGCNTEETQMSVVKALYEFNMNRAVEKEKLLRTLYFAFLLFEPSEPVTVTDLAILWGYEGADFDKGLVRSKALCYVLEAKGLIRRLRSFASHAEYFVVHPLLFQAAMQDGLAYYSVDTLEQLRVKIIFGCCRADPQSDLAGTVSAIPCETTTRCRRAMLEKIIKKTGAKHLAVAFGERSPQSQSMTLLHFLYSQDWPASPISPRHLNKSSNLAYRYVGELLLKFSKANISIDAMFKDVDPTFNCLLIDVYDQEGFSLYAKDRRFILSFIPHLRHDYSDCKWERNAIENSGQHPAIVASRNGDVEVVKQYFGKAFKDETEKSLQDEVTALQIAARHGHFAIVEYLLNEFSVELTEYRFQLLRAFMHAAGSGNMQTVQLLLGFLEERCSNTDSDGMTVAMHAAKGGNTSIIELLCQEIPESLNVQDHYGFTATTFAAERGHKSVVEALYRKNVDLIKTRTADDRTPLILAATNGHLEVVKFLHEKYPAAVRQPTKRKILPLMAAADKGHLKVVQFLYDSYPEAVEAMDTNGWTALTHAASKGHLDVVDFLFRKYRKAGNLGDMDGITPMMVAASNGHDLVLEYLYKNGCDIGAQTEDGMTAFMFSCAEGHGAIVKFFIDKNISVLEVVDSREFTGLRHAVVNGHLEMVQFLYNRREKLIKNRKEDDYEDFMTVMHAVLTGHINVLKFLCEHHPKALRLSDSTGHTVLMAASGMGFCDIVQYLFEQYSEAIEQKDNEGYTCLMRASGNGDMEVVQFLYEQFPDAIYSTALDGSTCLLVAARAGQLKAVNFLYDENSAALSMANKEGLTPVMAAAEGGHLSVVQFLLEQDPTISSVQDKAGMTALAHAAINDRLEVCKALAESDSCLAMYQDYNGITPLAHAVIKGHMQVVEFLYEQYPDSLIVADYKSQVPLMHSIEQGNMEMVTFLLEKGIDAVKMRNAAEETVFTMCLDQDRLEYLQLLIEKFPEGLKSVDKKGWPLLAHAVSRGNANVVELVYEKYPGALSIETNNGLTPTSIAASLGFVEIVKVLYQQEKECISKLDRNGNMPVAYAYKNGHQEVVSYLCERMPTMSLPELMSYASVDTVFVLCKNVKSLSDWENLLGPLNAMAQFEKEANTGRRLYQTIENLDEFEVERLAKNLQVICEILISSDKYISFFIKAGGFETLYQLQVALRVTSQVPVEKSVVEKRVSESEKNSDSQAEEDKEENKDIDEDGRQSNEPKQQCDADTVSETGQNNVGEDFGDDEDLLSTTKDHDEFEDVVNGDNENQSQSNDSADVSNRSSEREAAVESPLVSEENESLTTSEKDTNTEMGNEDSKAEDSRVGTATTIGTEQEKLDDENALPQSPPNEKTLCNEDQVESPRPVETPVGYKWSPSSEKVRLETEILQVYGSLCQHQLGRNSLAERADDVAELILRLQAEPQENDHRSIQAALVIAYLATVQTTNFDRENSIAVLSETLEKWWEFQFKSVKLPIRSFRTLQPLLSPAVPILLRRLALWLLSKQTSIKQIDQLARDGIFDLISQLEEATEVDEHSLAVVALGQLLMASYRRISTH